MFQKGCDIVEQELDLFSIMQTIQKMKASISVLIENRQDIILKAKAIYVKKQTILSDTEQEQEEKAKFNNDQAE